MRTSRIPFIFMSFVIAAVIMMLLAHSILPMYFNHRPGNKINNQNRESNSVTELMVLLQREKRLNSDLQKKVLACTTSETVDSLQRDLNVCNTRLYNILSIQSAESQTSVVSKDSGRSTNQRSLDFRSTINSLDLTDDASLDSDDDTIDAVIMWVDGNDPAYQRDLAKYRREHGSEVTIDNAGNHRFRDNGELKYLLRSIEMHASWFRHIHLVLNPQEGQYPPWLVKESELGRTKSGIPKLKVWRHHHIFPNKNDLPTFNSNAIQMHLHRIPGISKRFVLFEDDMFINRPLSKDYFYSPEKGIRLLYESMKVNGGVNRRLLNSEWDALNFTYQTLASLPSPLGEQFRSRDRFYPGHTALILDRDIWDDFVKAVPLAVAQTSSHRVRAKDLHVGFAFQNYVLILDEIKSPKRSRIAAIDPSVRYYDFVQLQEFGNSRNTLENISNAGGFVICVNDDMGDDAPDNVIRDVIEFYESLYPLPSAYEVKNV